MKYGWDGARRKGFTIIEVMLFLAISGFLLVGILAGTGAGISRQRYTDSVQHVAQLLREQYSAVINTQIPERELNNGGFCYSPSPEELLSGGKITGDALNEYYDADGNLREGNAGRGRTTCLVYGVMVTLGAKSGTDLMSVPGTRIQTTALVGKDVQQLVEEGKVDLDNDNELDILRKAGVNNLGVFYDVSGSGGSISNWQCWVRTSGVTNSYNLQWEAITQTLSNDKNINTLEATIIIFRSPVNGAIRTYVMNKAIKYNNEVVDYSVINAKNDGKGYGLQAENNGDCNGTISTSQGGYKYLTEAGVNKYLKEVPAGSTDDGFALQELKICVGSDELFAYAGRRRMISVARDGHNTGAVELVSAEDLTGRNECEQ